MEKFITQIKVRHYELDTLGHLNNAVYQNYLEQAAIEHMEYLEFNLDRYQQLGGVFVLRRIKIDYLRPAFAGDTLEITTWIQDMRGSRSTRHYEIRKQADQQLLVTAEALWVWVDIKAMRPKAMPKELLNVEALLQNIGN
ncbi:4-hydroxybenzoyl-CoA thioesterase [Crinalium epipsammum PCC 9333]|uniref:4-hydroxybenzoyl-CoA thioesterase n=1 Tax=Crinalium epipsammum PCC 9333 TaxID=1173022 RepID=K9W174_9CYAN|nr:thioesterase family protein [Crinalium epipsammum]AFZ14108.1 4-hydroxybenzoyl-CoA thioesterase [Crinalium epipsammum PCC 9333]